MTLFVCYMFISVASIFLYNFCVIFFSLFRMCPVMLETVRSLPPEPVLT